MRHCDEQNDPAIRPSVVGTYWIVMKLSSDSSFRGCRVQGIVRRVKAKGVDVVVYEPALEEATFLVNVS